MSSLTVFFFFFCSLMMMLPHSTHPWVCVKCPYWRPIAAFFELIIILCVVTLYNMFGATPVPDHAVRAMGVCNLIFRRLTDWLTDSVQNCSEQHPPLLPFVLATFISVKITKDYIMISKFNRIWICREHNNRIRIVFGFVCFERRTFGVCCVVFSW